MASLVANQAFKEKPAFMAGFFFKSKN